MADCKESEIQYTFYCIIKNKSKFSFSYFINYIGNTENSSLTKIYGDGNRRRNSTFFFNLDF